MSEHDVMRLVDLATRRYTPAGVTLFGPQMILALLFVIERGEVTGIEEARYPTMVAMLSYRCV